MGIDLQQYRACIGNFYNISKKRSNLSKNTATSSLCNELSICWDSLIFLLYYLILSYLLPLLLRIYIDSKNVSPLNFNTTPLFILKCHTNFLLIIKFSTIYAYLASIFLKSNLKLKTELLNLVISVSYIFVHCLYFISSFILLYNLSLSIELTTISSIAFLYAYNGRINYHANKITLECNSYAIATLTIFLIIICNTSILNPGPTNKIEGLTCFYQNIQGLVTFGSIGNPHPDLNITKVSEMQSYIFDSSPDIIILNEIWLKPCINNKEIIPGKLYKIFSQ